MKFEESTVMIVEDEQYYRHSLAAAIKFTLYATVIEAENGQDAIDYLEKNDLPDLILLDNNMPIMDGISTLKYIRKNPILKDVAVIPYTQSSDEELVKRFVKLGIKDFIIKGNDLESMLKKISNALLKVKFGDDYKEKLNNFVTY